MVLPGDTIKFPFVFKSPNAGVFSEQWQFETRPILCGGANLVVTLRGVALQEDKYEKERSRVEVRNMYHPEPMYKSLFKNILHLANMKNL